MTAQRKFHWIVSLWKSRWLY